MLFPTISTAKVPAFLTLCHSKRKILLLLPSRVRKAKHTAIDGRKKTIERVIKERKERTDIHNKAKKSKSHRRSREQNGKCNIENKYKFLSSTVQNL